MQTQYSAGTVDRTMGVTSLVLVAAAALCLALPVPWQLRLGVISIAGILGPGAPGLRFLMRMDAFPSVVIGAGLDVALLMTLGQSMLLANWWKPDVAFTILLAATFAAGVGLLIRAREGQEPT
jgi:hypothetical protein